ncbi:ATP-dependent DNA ligase [Thalassorhabdus alkalitolerans]|uniref:ATP-dependent DNA ligase n=1 Tax=Thalassorhabdus alkalitolerans TaxID=2282697 RepID=A0ABW0YHV2_9BACI
MIQPMLLHKAMNNAPFNSTDYLAELKLDGIRMIITNIDHRIRLYTRNQLEVTEQFPELQSLVLPPGTTIDGELIAADEKGRPDYDRLMERFHSGICFPVTFTAFDVLHYKGRDVTNLTLIERKMILIDVIPQDSTSLTKVKYTAGEGPALFEAVKERMLEGIVLKEKYSKYILGHRSCFWLKVINLERTDVWVNGYQKNGFGLHLAHEDGSPAGIVETGMSPKEKAAFYYAANQITQKETEDVVYLEPGIIQCRVLHRPKTNSGKLRAPSFSHFLFQKEEIY